MAVYYKWIKGCQAGAKLANTEGASDAGLWTYLTWGSGTTGVEQMPLLKANIGKDDTTQSKNFGYFLTSNMPQPLIKTDFRFSQTIYFIEKEYTIENESFGDQNTKTYTWLQQTGPNKFQIKGCSGKDATDSSTIIVDCNEFFINQTSDGQVFKVNSYANRFKEGVDIDGRVTIHDPKPEVNAGENDGRESPMLDVRGFLKAGEAKLGASGDNYVAHFPKNETENGVITFNRTLTVSGYPVNAQYFNATSDKRAKENIKLATYNALELIKKLPVYIYNYKNSSENVTGILAQDLLEAQPKELDLVSNVNATGENNDYMSIKNDKLMFVLMKAIQEQQEQIERLESEIAKLKNLI